MLTTMPTPMKTFCIFVLIGLATTVNSFPHGAPECYITLPHHHDNVPQTGTPPYQVTTSKASIKAGDTITVTITATDASQPFKGFLLRALDDSAAVWPVYGNFIVGTSEPQFHSLPCDSPTPTGAITHNDNSTKTSVQASWTSPDDYSGDIYFLATIVKKFDTFWVNVPSPPVAVSTTKRNLASDIKHNHKIEMTQDRSSRIHKKTFKN